MSTVECSALGRTTGCRRLCSSEFGVRWDTCSCLSAPINLRNVYWGSRNDRRSVRSPLSKRPNSHALPPQYWQRYISAYHPPPNSSGPHAGILTTISAKATKPFGVVACGNFAAPSGARGCPPVQAPWPCASRGCYDRNAASSREDRLGREYFGGRKAGNE